jgi:hypothetical protein
MNDFVTSEQLASFGAAVAAVIAIVNTARMLGGEKLEPYSYWAAAVAALGVTIVARGVPQTLNAGLTLVVNATYVFLAALGGNEAVVGLLGRRQAKAQPIGATEREIIVGASMSAKAAPKARFWRRW